MQNRMSKYKSESGIVALDDAVIIVQFATITRISNSVSIIVNDPTILQQKAVHVDLLNVNEGCDEHD